MNRIVYSEALAINNPEFVIKQTTIIPFLNVLREIEIAGVYLVDVEKVEVW
jgi:hypothetical protein